MPSPPQDSQCGTVIDVSIDCAVKLIGTNCIIYPVNSKDLQHIWVSTPPAPRPRRPLRLRGPLPLAARLLLPVRARAHTGSDTPRCDGSDRRCGSLYLVSFLL